MVSKLWINKKIIVFVSQAVLIYMDSSKVYRVSFLLETELIKLPSINVKISDSGLLHKRIKKLIPLVCSVSRGKHPQKDGN